MKAGSEPGRSTVNLTTLNIYTLYDERVIEEVNDSPQIYFREFFYCSVICDERIDYAIVTDNSKGR